MDVQVVAAAVSAELVSPSFEEALKTPIGRKWPPSMREVLEKVAAGNTLEGIARETRISVDDVQDSVDRFVRALRCRRPELRREGRTNRGLIVTKTPRTRNGSRVLNAPPTMIEASCAGCGSRIEKGEERAILIACVALYVNKEDEGHVPSLDIRKEFHYCGPCARAEDLRVQNPWHERWTPQELEWLKEVEAEAAVEINQEKAHLQDVIARGDMHAFNKAMPTCPDRRGEDALGRSTLACDFAAKATDRAIQSGSVNAGEGDEDAFEQQCTTSLPDFPSPYGPGAIEAGEAAQRAKVREYLDSPRSRGKLTENQRQTARFWLQGETQQAIAQKLRIGDRSTVSRYMKIVIQKSFAPN
jgi:DNA-binding NarL/FixJ family response regulator